MGKAARWTAAAAGLALASWISMLIVGYLAASICWIMDTSWAPFDKIAAAAVIGAILPTTAILSKTENYMGAILYGISLLIVATMVGHVAQ